MSLLKLVYKITHRGVADEDIPYYWKYSVSHVIMKVVRKWMSQTVIPYCPFNNLRVSLYRLVGFKIGKNVFIGMRCYLDDMCYDLMEIEDDVIISYGVFFACHGKKQKHYPIVIKKGAYIGMRSNIIARREEGTIIGENAVVGAASLVNKSVAANTTVAGIPARVLS